MIGERIKELRIKNGETQETLAKAIGVTAQAVSKWENNATTPDISLLVPIADYFGVSTDYLLREADTSPTQSEQPLDTDALIKVKYAYQRGQQSYLKALARIKNITPHRINKLDYRAKFYDENGTQVDERDRYLYDLFPNVAKEEMLFSSVTAEVKKIVIEALEVEYAEE